MVLNIWESIQKFFKDLFSAVSWGNLALLFTGIVIGVVICMMCYVIIVLQSIKKADKNNKLVKNEEDIIKTNETNKAIRGAKDQFKEEGKDYSVSQKIDCVKNISWTLIQDIAKIYYPESKYPIYELSVDELIKLCYYITDRIDKVFEGRIIRLVRGFKVSQVISLIDAKKKIDDNKIVKASKKVKAGAISKVATAALNIVNPVYWIKKLMISSTLNIGTNRIADILLDIVGEETAKVYSKHLFTSNDEIDRDIALLQEELNEE